MSVVDDAVLNYSDNYGLFFRSVGPSRHRVLRGRKEKTETKRPGATGAPGMAPGRQGRLEETLDDTVDTWDTSGPWTWPVRRLRGLIVLAAWVAVGLRGRRLRGRRLRGRAAARAAAARAAAARSAAAGTEVGEATVQQCRGGLGI